MADVRLTIGGRTHVVACRAGGEMALEELGRRLDAHAAVAARAAGGQGGERTMLYIALMLADELSDAERTQACVATPDALLDAIAVRLESVADALEEATANA